jgi:hypothetical protein
LLKQGYLLKAINSLFNFLLIDIRFKIRVKNLFSLMLRKKEKQTLTRLFLLGVGAPIGLDRFYEGDVTGGLLAILGFILALITVVGLLVWIIPFISKTFRLLREFEDAED